MSRSSLLLVVLSALLLVHAFALGCGGDATIAPDRPALAASASEAPPLPPPPDCPSCAAELPASACPAVNATQLEYRCNTEMDRHCPVLGGDAHLHILSAGCWDGTCTRPPPWALHVGDSPCAQGATTNEVQLFCW